MTKKSRTHSVKLTPSAEPSCESIGMARKSSQMSGLLPTLQTADVNMSRFTPEGARKRLEQGKFQHSLAIHVSTSSPAASPASPSPKLVYGKAQVTSDISGQPCLPSFQSLDRAGLSLKMLKDYLLYQTDWCLSLSAPIWKEKVTKCNRLLFQLAPSARRTEGTGSGLLPTANARDSKNSSNKMTPRIERKLKQGRTIDLNDRIALLRTPSASEGEHGGPNARDSKGGLHLSSQIARTMLTTPSTRDWKDGPGKIKDRRDGKQRLDQLPRQIGAWTGERLRLQPALCEWMMGYPSNWTDLNSPKPDTESNA